MIGAGTSLERDGLPTRTPSQKDRRAHVVEVTEEGRRLVASTEDVLDDLYGEVLGRLPEADRESFLRSLAILVDGRSPVVTADRAPRRRAAR